MEKKEGISKEDLMEEVLDKKRTKPRRTRNKG